MSDTPPTTLDLLRATLEEALAFTRELGGDPLLSRLLATFRAMPAEDRPVVLEALEREVAARKLSCATEDVSGQSMTPNPNARFYLRAHETGFDRSLLERDEMLIATVRGMRAATLIPAIPEVHAAWRDATREAMQHVDDATRTAVESLVRDVLQFLVDARATGSEAATAVSDATTMAARES
jgi:hypothetical protein